MTSSFDRITVIRPGSLELAFLDSRLDHGTWLCLRRSFVRDTATIANR